MGCGCKVRRSFGPQLRVLLLVAYGVRPNGQRQLLGFLRARGKSQAAWEGMLQNLFRRGLLGNHLHLIIMDGCTGLAQRCRRSTPKSPSNVAGCTRRGHEHATISRINTFDLACELIKFF